ncbi:uncharacterized protein VTP21DRAFT_1427 [Calcarisporiella thermophila]|uniref:uncharacterized protein n=1 Tax=Calcarisporiella thermophila TaxID=911321 RepID=UPI003744768E
MGQLCFKASFKSRKNLNHQKVSQIIEDANFNNCRSDWIHADERKKTKAKSTKEPLKASKKAKQGKRITKDMIGVPTNFQHTKHIGANEVKNIPYDGEKLRLQMAEVAAAIQMDFDANPSSSLTKSESNKNLCKLTLEDSPAAREELVYRPNPSLILCGEPKMPEVLRPVSRSPEQSPYMCHSDLGPRVEMRDRSNNYVKRKSPRKRPHSQPDIRTQQDNRLEHLQQRPLRVHPLPPVPQEFRVDNEPKIGKSHYVKYPSRTSVTPPYSHYPYSYHHQQSQPFTKMYQLPPTPTQSYSRNLRCDSGIVV